MQVWRANPPSGVDKYVRKQFFLKNQSKENLKLGFSLNSNLVVTKVSQASFKKGIRIGDECVALGTVLGTIDCQRRDVAEVKKIFKEVEEIYFDMNLEGVHVTIWRKVESGPTFSQKSKRILKRSISIVQ